MCPKGEVAKCRTVNGITICSEQYGCEKPFKLSETFKKVGKKAGCSAIKFLRGEDSQTFQTLCGATRK